MADATAGPLVGRLAWETTLPCWLLLCLPAGTPSGSMVLSFGRGEDGQLGHGDAEDRDAPQAVFALVNRGVSLVACGAEYSCVVSTRERQLWSWGWG